MKPWDMGWVGGIAWKSIQRLNMCENYFTKNFSFGTFCTLNLSFVHISCIVSFIFWTCEPCPVCYSVPVRYAVRYFVSVRYLIRYFVSVRYLGRYLDLGRYLGRYLDLGRYLGRYLDLGRYLGLVRWKLSRSWKLRKGAERAGGWASSTSSRRRQCCRR